ncbi:Tetratricopeptide repeat protein 27 [Bagarius yarrelli]|uniref:Tetratricopeptide repeat protein 27 n=1 Tax=Bagarius yarrelli TaxID=175774 RepID=A0A556VVV8_BAGYA|nr:Tetratricopeptide repeat protein 27 [Bagarius yarrelli]
MEAAVLRGFLTETQRSEWKHSFFNTTDAGPLLQRVFEGDFEAVLLSVPVLEMLSGEPEQDDSIESYLHRRVLTYLNTNQEETKRNRLCVILPWRDMKEPLKPSRDVWGLEPENSEAWNNLSTALIKLRKK